MAIKPSIDAPRILEPLRDAFRFECDRLERRLSWRSAETRYWTIVRGLLLSSRDTFKAALWLISDDRRDPQGNPDQYAAQAILLGRSLFEAVGVMLALSEDRILRPRLLLRDSYRERAREFAKLTSRHAGSAKWAVPLAREGESLRTAATWLGLSPEEARDPVAKLSEWPRPGALIRGKWLSGTRREVFSELYEAYPLESRVAHQKDAALYYAFRRESRPSLELALELRNIPLCRVILYHLCLLSEIEIEGRWGCAPNPALGVVWASFAPIFDPAAAVLECRYRAHLPPDLLGPAVRPDSPA